VDGTVEIGRRHGLEAVSWGHAGDGNVHSNFLVRRDDPEELERVERAVEELFDLTIALGGSISGEHGLGWLKSGYLGKQWGARALDLHRAIKQAFDPKDLLNPGKKT
jgi:glycolate dehydrogenase FAD-linked subunit